MAMSNSDGSSIKGDRMKVAVSMSDSIDLPDAGDGQLDEVIVGIAEVEA